MSGGMYLHSEGKDALQCYRHSPCGLTLDKVKTEVDPVSAHNSLMFR